MPAKVLSLTLLLFASTAHADEPEVLGRDQLGVDLKSYYDGESRAAYIVMALGAVSIGVGGFLISRRDDFSRGLGWPLLTLGGLEGIGAILYAFQVRRQINDESALLASDPERYQREEITHMEGTTARFVIYRSIELGLAVVGAGLATYGFIAQRGAFQGVGIGLAAIGVPFFIIDTSNQSRAVTYLNQVKHLQPSLVVTPQGGLVGLRGEF